ncbi:hypothetical protein DP73_11565 [Desulfosporosinus sp. HMP52]|nr:hypothetical protein DP73_11565 [Desulfosporosinus sp. HMP52]
MFAKKLKNPLLKRRNIMELNNFIANLLIFDICSKSQFKLPGLIYLALIKTPALLKQGTFVQFSA